MNHPTRSNLRTLAGYVSAALLALSPVAQATEYTYTGTTAGTVNWSSGTNWSAVPVSASTTTLTFGNGTSLASAVSLTSNNNITSPPFRLNALNFTYAGPGSGIAPSLLIQGNQLEFISNGGTTPTFTLAPTGTLKPTMTITNNVLVTNDLAISNSVLLFTQGVFSGSGTITKSGTGLGGVNK